MLAARQQDPERLADDYRDIAGLVLTIDGLQPEKGHETLYVVRELMRKRVWCAEPLLSSATQEVRRVMVLARQWAERFDTPVRGWRSDKQEAFVTAIAAECPGTPHRDCHNHFLRDVAQPVLELDSRAKVKRRSNVRGLRAIERRGLEDRRHTAAPEPPPLHETPNTAEAQAPAPCTSSDLGLVRPDSALEATGVAALGDPGVADEAGEVVLGYCAAVRGMLNDSRGGPLHPPGLRMSEALQDVRDSLDRNVQAQQGGVQRRCCNVWPVAWTADWMSYGRPCGKLATTSRTCKQWIAS
jgi:hypothetical protein